MEPVVGRRVYYGDDECFKLQPGEYCKKSSGKFLFRVPDPKFHLGSLAGHQVTEHKDGTITVLPSILLTESNVGRWHGYLEHGVWSKCKEG